MLDNNPDLVDEMGPVLGLIAFIFDSNLPENFKKFSLQNHLLRQSKKQSASSIKQNDENGFRINSEMSEGKIEAIFELDQLMERLILLLAEYNQTFLEHTLQRLDKGIKARNLQNLFNPSNIPSSAKINESMEATEDNHDPGH